MQSAYQLRWTVTPVRVVDVELQLHSALGQEKWQQSKLDVHELWQIQYVPDACRNHSAVLCIEILIFQVPREEKGNHQ
jgi:hypothetical protein